MTFLETSRTRSSALAAKELILARQRNWANSIRIPTEAGYCITPEQNLKWLTERIRNDVEEGDGNEFGKRGKRGKICALHSSSALALNVFGYWQSRERIPLQNALGLTSAIDDVRFERKFDTGVPPHSPNLDVVLLLTDGSILAIESKFTEWFGYSGRKPLREPYLQGGARRWADVGLDGAQLVAERYLETPQFARLDVPQLLKHMLGLATQRKPWHLILVWYRQPGTVADEMDNEILRFKQFLGEDSPKFSAVTYQDLWRALRSALGRDHREYESYLSARYF